MGQRIAVVGYGSTVRQDDRAGIDALYLLEEIYKENGLVDTYEGYTAIDLLGIFGEYDKLILIDAGDIDAEPGRFIRRPFSEMKLKDDTSFSHNTNFAKVLEMGKDLGLRAPEMVFYVIQPKNLTIGENLSLEVRDGMHRMVKEIRKEIDGT